MVDRVEEQEEGMSVRVEAMEVDNALERGLRPKGGVRTGRG